MFLYFFFIRKASNANKRSYDKAFGTSPPTNESIGNTELMENSGLDSWESMTLDNTSNTMDFNICLDINYEEKVSAISELPKDQQIPVFLNDISDEQELDKSDKINTNKIELVFQPKNYSIDTANIFGYPESYKEDYLEKILISFQGIRPGLGGKRPSNFYLWFRDQKLKYNKKGSFDANKKQQNKDDDEELLLFSQTTSNNFTFKFKEKRIILKVPNKLVVNLIIRTKIIERITSFRLITLLVFLNEPGTLLTINNKESKITKNFFASLGLFVDKYILDFSMKKFYLFYNDSNNQNTYIDTRNLDYASKIDYVIEELITSFKNLVRDSFNNFFPFFKKAKNFHIRSILGLENYPNCDSKELFLKKLFRIELSKMPYEILKLMFPELEELIELISIKKLDSHKFLCLYFMLEILVFKFEIFRTEINKETYASSRKRLLYLKKSSLIRNFIFSSRIFIYLNCCFLLDFDENSMFIANLLLKTFLNFVDIKNQLYLKLFVFDDFFLEKFKLSESQFSDASFETNKMFYGENEIDFFDVPLLESLPNKWIKHKSENINEFLLEIILENKPDFFDKEKSKYLVYLKEREFLFNLEKYMSDQQLSFTIEFNQQII